MEDPGCLAWAEPNLAWAGSFRPRLAMPAWLACVRGPLFARLGYVPQPAKHFARLLCVQGLGGGWPVLSCVRRPGFNAGSELAKKKEIEKEKEEKRKEKKKERRGEERRGKRKREREKREERRENRKK